MSRSWLCPAGLRISWTKPQDSDKSQCPQHGQLQLGMGLHLPGPAQRGEWGQREEEKSMRRMKKRRKGKDGYSEARYAGSLCLAFSFVIVIPQGPGWGSAHRGLLRKLRMSRSQHGRVDWANSTNPAQNPLPRMRVTTHHAMWWGREGPGSPSKLLPCDADGRTHCAVGAPRTYPIPLSTHWPRHQLRCRCWD